MLARQLILLPNGSINILYRKLCCVYTEIMITRSFYPLAKVELYVCSVDTCFWLPSFNYISLHYMVSFHNPFFINMRLISFKKCCRHMFKMVPYQFS
jgi:hypothetical protein